MLKSISKKVGAVVLSAAMALSLAAVAPVSADAATAYTMTNKAGQEVEIGAASTYYVKGVKATQYVKVVPRGEAKSGITVKHQGKLIKATQMVKGTKNGTFGIVTTADESVAGKQYNVWVYIYNSKTATKPVKTLKGGAVTVKENKVELTAAQTGVNKVSVAGKDLVANDIVLTRNNVKVNATVEVATDGKTAEIKTAGNLIAGEYVVTMGEQKATFTAEDSKIESISILSNVLVMESGFDGAAKDDATVGYKVVNQFGDDITKGFSLQASTSAANAVALDGVATVTVTGGKLNDVVSLVLLDKTTGKSTSATLTLSNEAKPAEIIAKGIYNEKGNVLSATNTADFFFLFQVKDQYGNFLTKTTDLALNTNYYLTVDSGLTNLTFGAVTTKKVDGVTYLAYPITVKDPAKDVAKGTMTVIQIAAASGKSTTSTIDVAAGAIVDTITVTVPSIVPANEKVEFGYTALDAAGNLVTDKAQLSKVLKAGSRFAFVKENGAVKLYYNAPSTAGPDSEVFTTPTLKTTIVSVIVKDAAYPKQIIGLKDGKKAFATAAVSGDDITVTSGNIVVADQYGRTMKALPAAYGISANAVSVDEDAFAIKTNAIDKIVFTANKTGSKSYTFTVVSGDGSVIMDGTTNRTSASAYTETFTATTLNKFTSYEVEDIAKIYVSGNATPAGYETEVVAYGVVNSSTKVKLVAGRDFVVIPGKNLDLSANDLVAASTVNFGTDKTELDAAYTLIMNDGTKVDKTTKVSKVAPVVAKVEFKDADAKMITVSSNNVLIPADIINALKAENDYAKPVTVNTSVVKSITVTDIKSKAGNVSKNGDATGIGFTGFVSDDTFTVTVNVGGVEFTSTVVVE